MNIYLHKQLSNQWHETPRYWLDDFEDGSPRRADSRMYFRVDTVGLYPDTPTWFQSGQEALHAVEGTDYIVINAGSMNIAELRKDKARIDWLETATIGNIEPGCAFPDSNWRIWAADGSGIVSRGKTLRDAVDAAMKGTP